MTHPAFQTVRTQPVAALNLEVQEYRHRVTRARHIHLATDDEGILTQAAQRWLDKGYGGFKLAASEDWEPF